MGQGGPAPGGLLGLGGKGQEAGLLWTRATWVRGRSLVVRQAVPGVGGTRAVLGVALEVVLGKAPFLSEETAY